MKPGPGDQNGYRAVELGEGSSIKDNILTIVNPVFLIKENEESYSIVSAISASHQLKDLSEIRWEKGKIETFKFNSSESEPSKSSTFEKLTMDVKTKKVVVLSVGPAVKKL